MNTDNSSETDKGKSSNKKYGESIMAKIGIIIVLVLGLLIPVWMISGVITERQNRKNDVSREIADTWGGSQTVTGPILVLPYKTTREYILNNERRKDTITQRAYLLPNQYSMTDNLKSGVRYRGIYKSIVYTGQILAQGKFSLDDLKELNVTPESILWNDAFFAINISQTKSIAEPPVLECNGKSINIFPGTHGIQLFDTGLYAPYPLNNETREIPFSLKLAVKGSNTFSFVPIGKQNKFFVSSDWPSPSFTGSLLPSARSVDANGFKANWDISYFARNYPQVFSENATSMMDRMRDSQVGVSLLNPVDFYRQSDRAIKYAILFLVLTFSTYFIFEILGRLRLHPFQYFLIGCALCLFYLLLLAFSEVIGFDLAYGIASVAIVGALTLYSYSIMGKMGKYLAILIGGLLSLLYVYLYILLQLEDLSLLCGTIGLFIFLVLIMYLTRNIDWYKEQLAPI